MNQPPALEAHDMGGDRDHLSHDTNALADAADSAAGDIVQALDRLAATVALAALLRHAADPDAEQCGYATERRHDLERVAGVGVAHTPKDATA